MKKDKYENFYHHTRNYGCRFHEVIYKGFRTLIIENERIRMSILLDKGADILEFLFKPLDIDFMWRSPIDINNYNKISTRKREEGDFLDYYEGCWQEMLPSIMEPHNYKNTNMGLHGEAFCSIWDYEVLKDDPYELIINLKTRMLRTPFLVEKKIIIKSCSDHISFHENIKNESNEEFEFLWGQHITLGKPFLDEYCYIDLPDGIKAKTYYREFSDSNILPLNENFKWPVAKTKNNNLVDISKVFKYDSKTDFRVLLELPGDGWFGITHLRKNIGFGLVWDPKIYKHLKLWFNYNGFLGFPFYGKCFNIGMEPISAITDNLDKVLGTDKTLKLKPLESIKTTYTAVVYETKKRINGFDDQLNPIIGK